MDRADLTGVRLYALTDARFAGARGILAAAGAVIRGGAGLIQYREKQLPDGARLAELRALAALCHQHRVPLIVNDRPDLVLLAGADGVHLGQDDLPIAAVRELLGPRLIGRSTHSLAQALAAQREGADYLGVGPVFATQTKADVCAPVGLELVREVAACRELTVPWFAIGGIKLHNVQEVLAAGAARVAVVSDLMAAPDPQAQAAAFSAVLQP